MTIEILSELENKIDSLIQTVVTLKKENEELKEDARKTENKVREFEEEKESVGDAIGSLKKECEDRQKKLDTAAERIRGLISKLESVQ